MTLPDQEPYRSLDSRVEEFGKGFEKFGNAIERLTGLFYLIDRMQEQGDFTEGAAESIREHLRVSIYDNFAAQESEFDSKDL